MQEITNEFFKDVYFIPDAFTKQGGVWPIRIGQNIAKPNYQVGPRIIGYYNFHCVMEGQVELIYNRQQTILGKGDVFCMYPGTAYQYRYSLSDKPLEMLWISFDGAQAPAILAKAGFLESTPFLKQVLTKELNHALQHLFVPPTDGFKRQLELQALLYRIFSYMMPQDVSEPTRIGSAQWIPKSIEYMKTHYMERITVQDISAYFSVHRGYFSKIFAQQVGMTPMHYLEKLRMEKAIELLQMPDYTINEISLTIGYLDPYTFTRAFSKYYGIPPGKWRKSKQGWNL
jgi:AraC-like DNA-binding protein